MKTEKNIIILAGGISSRMKNSLPKGTAYSLKPKSMIPFGPERRPFLDYLLSNISSAGYDNAVIVTGGDDNTIPEYYRVLCQNKYSGLNLSYIEQPIPAGREKPMGTTDAMLRVLNSRPEWAGTKFTICNSDNLYSIKALKTLADSDKDNALIDYSKESLGLPDWKVNKFAVTVKDKQNYLTDILEKPDEAELAAIVNTSGDIGVSMNLWLFSYDQIIGYAESTPLHPVRGEKELPVTVKIMIQEKKHRVFAYAFREKVPDLSSSDDIDSVNSFIDELSS